MTRVAGAEVGLVSTLTGVEALAESSSSVVVFFLLALGVMTCLDDFLLAAFLDEAGGVSKTDDEASRSTISWTKLRLDDLLRTGVEAAASFLTSLRQSSPTVEHDEDGADEEDEVTASKIKIPSSSPAASKSFLFRFLELPRTEAMMRVLYQPTKLVN